MSGKARKVRVSCDQCAMLSINGVACHETGCPNAGATWSEERQAWNKYYNCFECGSPVEVGEACNCTEPEEDSDEDEEEYEEETEDHTEEDSDEDEEETI